MERTILFTVLVAVLASKYILQISCAPETSAQNQQGTDNDVFERFNWRYRECLTGFPNEVSYFVQNNETKLNVFLENMEKEMPENMTDYKKELFNLINCSHLYLINSDQNDVIDLFVFLYIQYLTIQFYHRFVIILKFREDNKDLSKKINEYVAKNEVSFLDKYLDSYAIFGPNDIVFRILLETEVPGVDKDQIKKVKKMFDEFYDCDYNYGSNDKQQSTLSKYILQKAPSFKCLSSVFAKSQQEFISNPEKYLQHMEFLNDFFLRVLPGCKVIPPPTNDINLEFNLLKGIMNQNLFDLPVGAGESRLCTILKTITEYISIADASRTESWKIAVPAPDASTSSASAPVEFELSELTDIRPHSEN